MGSKTALTRDTPKSSSFDSRYSPSPSLALAYFWAAIADVNNNPVNIMTVGDSKTEGQAASVVSTAAGTSTRWTDLLLAKLRAAFQPAGVVGGSGYVPAIYGFTSPANQGFALVGSPSVRNTLGLGLRNIQMTTTGQKATITRTCTSFDTIYTKLSTGAKITPTIDTVAGTDIDTYNVGTTLRSQKTNSGALSAASHAIELAWKTGTGSSAWLEGAFFYNGDETKGIRLWDAAHAGYACAQFTPTLDGTNGSSAWQDGIALANPHLIICSLGTNDCIHVNAVTYEAQYRAILDSMLAKAPSASLVMQVPEVRADRFDIIEPWSRYVAAMYRIAVDYNMLVWDLTTRLGTQTDALGLRQADKLHYTDKGNAFLANSIHQLLLAGR